MRLIDADALKENIKEQAELCRLLNSDEMTEYANMMEFGFCKLVDNALTIDSQPQWILCSERLPNKTVLCCDNRGEMIIGVPYKDEESNTEFSAESDTEYIIDCVAWMPLPEPYKEVNDEIN